MAIDVKLSTDPLVTEDDELRVICGRVKVRTAMLDVVLKMTIL